MAPVLGFDDDVKLGAFDRSVMKQTLVVDLDDVAGMLANHARQPRQGAGYVRQLATQADEPTLAHQTTHQDRGEQPRIHIAAGDHDCDLPAAKPLGFSKHSGEPGRTGTLHDELLAL